jgi:hypothetical protein
VSPSTGPRRGLEHVAQRGDERVDAAAEVLQVHEQYIERVEHCVARAPHLAVQAEHRDAVHGIVEIRRLHHVVLLVAAQPVLRSERRREPHVAERGDGVERVFEPGGDGCGMREQRDAAAGQRTPQRGLREQPVEAELHHE